jgi:phospholipase/lecithinase/hemolysin
MAAPQGLGDNFMRTQRPWARAALIFSAALLSTAAQAAPSQIVAFGDSLVDDGNIPVLTGFTFPSAPYAGARFSNGPVSVEIMAQSLGLSLDDRAVGGAYSGLGNRLADANPGTLSAIANTGTRQQIDFYINQKGGALDGDALYFIWAGGNDFFTKPEAATVSTVITNLANDVKTLYLAGARNFFIPNLPDLATTAVSIQAGGAVQAGANQLTVAFNKNLALNLGVLETKLAGADIEVFDAYSFLTTLRNGYAAQGFNVTQPCLVAGTVCADPSRYYLWDNVHPTAGVHSAIGTAMAGAVSAVPEPESWALGLVGMITAGMAARRRRLHA